jgi:uncharacterized protein
MNFPIKIGLSPTLKIRGIIATKDIRKNELIEICPMILIDKKYEKFIDETPLTNYYFEWAKDKIAILLGYGCLYNHSYNSNAFLTEDRKRNLMIFKAFKNIKKGTEVTINYNGTPNSKIKVLDNYLAFDKVYFKTT